MPRKATVAEAAAFAHHRVRGQRAMFATLADGEVWVLESPEVDLSPAGMVRFRTNLSTWCARNNCTGSALVRPKPSSGLPATHILVRITPKGQA